MAIPWLQAMEFRFRAKRDRLLGRWLYESHYARKAFLKRIGERGDLVIRSFDDHRVVIDPSDMAVSYEVMRSGAWQKMQFDAAIRFAASRGLLRDGGRFVDVGAHIGTQTIYAMLTEKFAGAVCLEPDPRNFDILTLNLLVNDLTATVHAERCAAGAREEVRDLLRDSGNRSAHGFVRPFSADTAEPARAVPVRPLDTFLGERGLAPGDISLVWIDVEGFEPQVLRGMSALLERSVPLVLEVSPHLYEGGASELVSLLQPSYRWAIDLLDEKGTPRPVSDLREVSWQRDFLVFAE